MSILMVFQLLGGLGLFLYGIKMMSDGLENVAGDRMRRTLERLTTNRFAGVAVGAGVTSLIQSSSAVTVMVVGFVNAGLMTLLQATGVIMGANIGTTITAQIIAFNITDVAPIIVFAGMILTMFVKKKLLKKIGYIIFGLGIVFVGLNVMSQAMEPLREIESFRLFLVKFKNPIMGVLVGAVFTAIIQSSSASVGILQTLALMGLIDLDSAAYIVLGQNIGTCVTAILASIGTNTNSKRAAGIHLSFNIIGTIIFLIILTVFPGLVTWVQNITGPNASRQIANFHTLFNVTVTIILFPFAKQIIALISKIIPEKHDSDIVERKLIFLDSRIAQTPAIAITQAIREMAHMGKIARNNLQMAIDAFFKKDESLVDKVMELEKTVNYFNHEITNYLIQIRGMKLSEKDLRVLGGLFHVVSDLERISDHAENIAEYAGMMAESRANMSPDGLNELETMSAKVIETIDACLDLFETRAIQKMNSVVSLEEEVDNMEETFVNNHIERLQTGYCDPKAGVIFTDMIIDLERVADHAINIAFSVKDDEHHR
ncbi:MAG TPA: Na/Pi cotransporter family protein [Clostridia bacterium]|nr:Na/Pi cotransporter family protein [Clostridia bacterium]